jgi:hypothetical protein
MRTRVELLPSLFHMLVTRTSLKICLAGTPVLGASSSQLASVWWTGGNDLRACRMTCGCVSNMVGEEYGSIKYVQVPSS